MTIDSFSGEKALFLGNGIHRTNNNTGISWGELLKKISAKFSINTNLDNNLKPFPLMFEEMLYTKVGVNEIQDKVHNLKTSISKILLDDAKNLIDNRIHKGFMNSGINEIITTNYDYNLESSIIPDFIMDKAKYSISNVESKHSLYRGYKLDKVNIRHIHGELTHNRKLSPTSKSYYEESIMIGFEHYSEYFTKIQSVIKGESGKQKDSNKKSILIRLRDKDTGKVWTDLFFTHKIIFAGFSLDFSENHLWWLILQREELRNKANRFDVKINNEIIFCIPELPVRAFNYKISTEKEFDSLYRIKLNTEKNYGVTDILKSLNISIDRIICSDYNEFYLRVIDKYSNK